MDTTQPTSPLPTAKVPKEDPKTKIFSIEILSIIKTSQNQHGLRHGDYQRYRQYCTRRSRRIRKSLHLSHGKKFQKKEVVPENITDDRFLLLVLVKAERAWAYAMHLKDDAATQPRVKYHMHRRLAKAVKHAKALESVCNNRADKKSVLEAEAYSFWMSGNFLLEKESWEEAFAYFVKSRTIYEQLGKVGEREYQELCKQRLEEIDPSIRYCNYNLKGKKGTDSDLIQLKMDSKGVGMDLLQAKLDSVISEALKKQADSMKEITWNGRKITIKNDKARMYILNAQEVSYELERTAPFEEKMALYDKLFVHYNDAIRDIKDELSTLATKKGGKEAQEENLNSLKNYITYLKATKTMERNLSMAGTFEAKLGSDNVQDKKTKPEELAKVYENLLQNATEVSELVSGDANESREIAAKALSFKALRCYYLGLSYLHAGKSPEALALFDRAREQIQNARNHHETCPTPNPDFLTKLAATEASIRGFKSEAHAKSFLQSVEKQQTPKEIKAVDSFLLDNLNTFVQSKHLIAFPPQLETAKFKPTLFDLAFESVDYPSLDSRTKAKGGWFGFWRS